SAGSSRWFTQSSRHRVSWVSPLALLFVCITTIPPAAQAAVGRTPGTFAVSPTGAATYAIPIWAPPGPRGVQPQISLAYRSQGGNGPEGLGWSIAGLSSIYRCNSTVAQDGAAASTTLTYADRFCMDVLHEHVLRGREHRGDRHNGNHVYTDRHHRRRPAGPD